MHGKLEKRDFSHPLKSLLFKSATAERKNMYFFQERRHFGNNFQLSPAPVKVGSQTTDIAAQKKDSCGTGKL